MILGIGNDITDIRRIESAITRLGDPFLARVFTENERAFAERRKGSKAYYGTYAKRFAAKEAAAKALGTGIAQGVSLQDIETCSRSNGQPFLCLHRKAHDRLLAMTPAGWVPKMNLSLSDEWPFAQAYVIFSAIPEEIAVG